MADSTLSLILVYPELLGLYGDRGNALALGRRALGRGIDTRIVEVAVGEPIPADGDVYLVGGAEDASMLVALDALRGSSSLSTVLAAGRPCLAVCAGLQLLGRSFTGPDRQTHEGLGVLDVTCDRLTGARAVGEVLVESTDAFGGIVTGFENHFGDALLGPDAAPLGRVRVGVGNGRDGVEGAVQAGIVATYLHGPVLVRNPRLADRLLTAAVGHPLDPLPDPQIERLRRERLRAAEHDLRRRHPFWWRAPRQPVDHEPRRGADI
jgi:CobQ-like glutamine amidotransferase family enzyme